MFTVKETLDINRDRDRLVNSEKLIVKSKEIISY